MSLRQLARASALYTFGNLAPKVGAFLLLPIYVRFLTQAEFGTLAIISSLSGLLGIVYRLGYDGSLMRLHFDVAPSERSRLYGSVMVFALGFAVVASVIAVAILGPLFGVLFPEVPFLPLGLLGVAIALVSVVQFVPATLFRATGQAGRFVVYNLGGFVLVSLMTVALVVAGYGVAGILVAQLIGAGVLLIIAIWVIGRLGPIVLDRTAIVSATRLGLPLVPHAISGWTLRLSDRWLIPLLIALPPVSALAALGSYALGYQLAYVVSLVVISVNAAWSPWFFRIGNEEWGPHVYREMVTIVMAGTIVLAVGISVIARELVEVMATPAYAPAADVLPVIAFASVAQGLYVMLSSVVFLVKATGRLALFTVVAALLNIGLNLVLIPTQGIMGAAFATLAAYGFFAAATFLYARRLYPLDLDGGRLAFITVLAVATVAASRYIPPDGDLLVSAVVHALMALAFAAIVVFVLLAPVRRLRGLMGQAGAAALA